jgi:hypothetical protein
MQARRWVILGLLGLALVPLQASAEPLPAPDALNQLAQQYQTPKAIASFLRSGFTFRDDREIFGQPERWQTPEEFLARRQGDCEDYAQLAKALLERNGYEAHVFSLFDDSGYAHTVAVFRDEDGRYSVINQDKLRRYRAKSLEAVASRVYPGWTYGGVAKKSGVVGQLVRTLSNSHPAASFDELPHLTF